MGAGGCRFRQLLHDAGTPVHCSHISCALQSGCSLSGAGAPHLSLNIAVCVRVWFRFLWLIQSASASLAITNHSDLPQKFAFVGLPVEVTVVPNEGFGTLLPKETVHVTLQFSPTSATGACVGLTLSSLPPPHSRLALQITFSCELLSRDGGALRVLRSLRLCSPLNALPLPPFPNLFGTSTPLTLHLLCSHSLLRLRDWYLPTWRLFPPCIVQSTACH